MIGALLIEIPDDVQPERFRWELHEALRAYLDVPHGRTIRESRMVLDAIMQAKIVELPGERSRPPENHKE